MTPRKCPLYTTGYICGGVRDIGRIPEPMPSGKPRRLRATHEKSRNKMRLLKLLVGATMSRRGRALHGQTVTNAPQLWPSHNEGKMRTKFKSVSHEKNKKRPKVVVYYSSGRGERIRTFDILLPKQALYQTELRPETTQIITVFF